MEEIIKLDTVGLYNKLYGVETLHPLVSVVDASEIKQDLPANVTLNYGLYALYLKQTKCGDLRYGRQLYDYQEGTVTSFAPGQVVEIRRDTNVRPQWQGLVFHPDLIRGTSLGQDIKQYSFFSYASNEALHLSDEEKSIYRDCLGRNSRWGWPVRWTNIAAASLSATSNFCWIIACVFMNGNLLRGAR